jgi:NHL repeat
LPEPVCRVLGRRWAGHRRRAQPASGVSATPEGGFLIADTLNHRVRRVSQAGTITTVAGTGTPAFGGDGGPAIAGRLQNPAGVTATADGGFLIADTNNDRVRRVSSAGTITAVAGTAPRDSEGIGGRPRRPR